MRPDVGETLEVSPLELWRRANTHGDLQAWAAFQQGLEGTVLNWLYEHPGSQAACRVYSELHFVALAFERLRQAVIQRRRTCETLSEVLVYLRACLNGVILETLRVSKRAEAVSSLWPDVEDVCDSNKVWDRLQSVLSSEREQRFAYLLYHCGMEPTEIVRCFPQEWSDIHDVILLQRVILKRLVNEAHR